MRFSVITPSFQQLDWLNLCAASIADQNVEVEHLVQDAGSLGMKAWAEKHPNVKVVVEKDEGMYDAINRGLRRATGNICAYLNCDEQYLVGTLQRVGDYFEHHPEIDVLFGDAILTDGALQPLSYRRVVAPRRWHTLLRPLNVLTCSTFFRRKIIDEGALFDPTWKIIGDKVWVMGLLNRHYRLTVLSEPLAVFALTGSNLSHDDKARTEGARWNEQSPAALRMIKPAVVGSHLLERWWKGAYQSRTCNSTWYTQATFPLRNNFKDATLGWNWPVVPKVSK
jgi:glycosyltransferase involved in cell wall biosynthesis